MEHSSGNFIYKSQNLVLMVLSFSCMWGWGAGKTLADVCLQGSFTHLPGEGGSTVPPDSEYNPLGAVGFNHG